MLKQENTMIELKQIAQVEKDIIGGEPKVYRYWDNSNVKYIDIMEADNRPDRGIKTCATIGLSKIDINLESKNKDLRIELIGACDRTEEFFSNIVASTVFNIMEKKECSYGVVIDNIIKEYMVNSEMEHVYLMNPFLWDDLDTIEFSDKWVTWLLVVPISEKEKQYAIQNGYMALEQLFEETQIDIFDLYRESVK